jgi:glycolate dehydrogenase iron-sulfur subunit
MDAEGPATQAPRASLGTDLPDGTRFIGEPMGAPGWAGPDHPSAVDLDACVACGLCLPHCPTYRLTGEETASPRGRIAAMRAVAEGAAEVDDRFREFTDLCLVCRACEDVCPSHVPFGRMMEHARTETEALRPWSHRASRRVGLDVMLPRKKLLWTAALLQPLVTPFLPRRVRALTPRPSERFRRMPTVTEPPEGVERRGTVALLTGCVQDRWFRDVNRATVRVLARNGWTVAIPRAQQCCGALPAHNGMLATARRLARRNAAAFAGADRVIVNAAGCGAHMQSYDDLVAGTELPVEDLMVFLDREGLAEEPPAGATMRVAYHDACHALRAQDIHDQPRRVLNRIGGLEIVEIADGDRCCGAAGLYNVTEPEMAGRLMEAKAEAVRATGATVIASANPGCSMQIVAGLRALGASAEVLHPVQLLDRAYAGERPGT